jgi:hypothetical protein
MRILKRELWPHRVVYAKDETKCEFGAMADWLENRVGQFGQAWHAVRCHNQTDLYFRNRADAVMFSLKWA